MMGRILSFRVMLDPKFGLEAKFHYPVMEVFHETQQRHPDH